MSERAGKYIKQPEGYRVFVPKPLPPEPAIDYDDELLITKGMTPESTRQALEVARQRLEDLPAFDAESLEGMLRPLAVELGLKTGQLFGALRTAVTGQTAAPPLFQTMAVLGRETSLKRIERALNRL